MCKHWDNVYACGHRAFTFFENCPNFGTTCYGNNGIHSDIPVADTCSDCKSRAMDPNPAGRDNDPYLEAAAAAARAREESEAAARREQQRQREAEERKRRAAHTAARASLQRLGQQQQLAPRPPQGQTSTTMASVSQGIAWPTQGQFQWVPGQGVQWVPAQAPGYQEQGQGASSSKGKGKGNGRSR